MDQTQRYARQLHHHSIGYDSAVGTIRLTGNAGADTFVIDANGKDILAGLRNIVGGEVAEPVGDGAAGLRGRSTSLGWTVASAELLVLTTDAPGTVTHTSAVSASSGSVSAANERDAISLRDLEVVRRQFEVAEANLRQAEKSVEDTRLYAPFDGKIAGHACGHHLFGTGSAAAGIAVKQWLEESGHSGCLNSPSWGFPSRSSALPTWP